MITVVPRYKVLVCYDIKPRDDNDYFQFVLNEYIPRLQGMGLYMYRVYHTNYGDYPLRQLDFIAENLEVVRTVMNSADWDELTDKLTEFVDNYSAKIYPFREGFQF
jgi:hypothetical protein